MMIMIIIVIIIIDVSLFLSFTHLTGLLLNLDLDYYIILLPNLQNHLVHILLCYVRQFMLMQIESLVVFWLGPQSNNTKFLSYPEIELHSDTTWKGVHSCFTFESLATNITKTVA